MLKHIDAVIIGGGQAGLAVSYYLTQQGRPHVVLEQAGEIVPAWRHQRWDSFTMVTPNWTVRLRGFPYEGGDQIKLADLIAPALQHLGKKPLHARRFVPKAYAGVNAGNAERMLIIPAADGEIGLAPRDVGHVRASRMVGNHVSVIAR